jgi:hypothetical protein
MKPSPHLVERAARAPAVEPDACTSIGDRTTDVQAARPIGAASTEYANKPGKSDDLAATGADAVIATSTNSPRDPRRLRLSAPAPRAVIRQHIRGTSLPAGSRQARSLARLRRAARLRAAPGRVLAGAQQQDASRPRDPNR